MCQNYLKDHEEIPVDNTDWTDVKFLTMLQAN